MKPNSIRMTLHQKALAKNILDRNLFETGEGVARAKIASRIGANITRREASWLKDR